MKNIEESGMPKQKVLTIAIPTYNRAVYLDQSLARICEQLKGFSDKIELIISDNCSIDNTEEVVHKHIGLGLDVRYIRNRENLGMDGNFVQCFRMAQSKYVWVLGDDDFLLPGSLERIIKILEADEYGLVHLKIGNNHSDGFVKHYNAGELYSEISFWITYISANIVNTKYVGEIQFEKYIGTYFTLIPLYLTALFKHPVNCMVRFRAFEDGAAFDTNGGYNFFQVFVENYLKVVYEFVDRKYITLQRFKREKFKLFLHYLLPSFFSLFFKRKSRHNYETKGALRILVGHYWKTWYFIPGFVYGVFKYKIQGR